MNFDKLMSSRINWFADWIIRIIVINILVILCSIPIITLYPAVNSGYSVFSDYVDRKPVRMVHGFFMYFKQRIGKKMLFGVIVLGISYLSFANTAFYSSVSDNTFYIVGYYVTLAMLAMLYALVLYTVVAFHVVPDVGLKRIVMVSLYMAAKYYYLTVVLVLLNMVPVILLFNQYTSVIFVFMGVSIPLLLHALVTKQPRMMLRKGNNQS